ncbi:hypothetical protein PRIPAC_81569 [Pristionchus pacificus]|uniref:Uncharacterized protein n=1 Tax=Pristionchus pacificus TaxID=54126 RepID=A0A2A6CLP7_PRIPA|nr:hypothetical protein PRIPAC_81569 [Pristionchus pacificus]|eukprot:PDM79018.1 hypothetical protein PRIPAC_31597 [Pristionchus pacificus]
MNFRTMNNGISFERHLDVERINGIYDDDEQFLRCLKRLFNRCAYIHKLSLNLDKLISMDIITNVIIGVTIAKPRTVADSDETIHEMRDIAQHNRVRLLSLRLRCIRDVKKSGASFLELERGCLAGDGGVVGRARMRHEGEAYVRGDTMRRRMHVQGVTA